MIKKFLSLIACFTIFFSLIIEPLIVYSFGSYPVAFNDRNTIQSDIEIFPKTESNMSMDNKNAVSAQEDSFPDESSNSSVAETDTFRFEDKINDTSSNTANVGDTFSDIFGMYEIMTTGEHPTVRVVGDTIEDYFGNFWYGNHPEKPWTTVNNGITYTVTRISCSLPGDNVNVPEGVTYIDNQVFKFASVKHLTLPSTLEHFDELHSFRNLESISVSESNPYFKTIDGVLFTKDSQNLILYPPYLSGDSYTTPEETRTIKENAFYYNQNLLSLTLSKVETIENYSFYAMHKIQTIYLPETFSHLMAKYTFYQCKTLQNIFVDKKNTVFFDIDGVLFHTDGKLQQLISYPASKETTVYRIPYGTHTIGNWAFNAIQNTQTIYIPSTVYMLYAMAVKAPAIPMNFILQFKSPTLLSAGSLDDLAPGSQVFVESEEIKNGFHSSLITLNDGWGGEDHSIPIIVDYETAVSRIENWYVKDGKKYYYDSNGELVTGMYNVGHGYGTYFFGPDHSMQTGFHKWDGKIYYFKPDTGVQRLARGSLEVDGKLFFIEDDSSVCQRAEVVSGASIYYLNTETGEVICDNRSHIYTPWSEDSAPTCSQEGARSRVCNKCAHRDTESLSSLPHTFGDWVVQKEATCSTPGLQITTCKICGQTGSAATSLKPHSSGGWEMLHKPSCTSQGTQVRHCTLCGNTTDTRFLPKLSHRFGPWKVTKAATNSTTGRKTHTCTQCHKSESALIPARNRKNITKAVFSPIRQCVYKGKNQSPSVTVKYGKSTLKKHRDYTVSYQNTKNPGRASVKVSGKGAYKETKTLFFYISPKAPIIQSLKSSKSKTLTLKLQRTTGAKGYQISYSTTKSFRSKKTIYTSARTKTLTRLSSRKTYYVKVRAYAKYGSKTIYGPYSKPKYVKVT